MNPLRYNCNFPGCDYVAEDTGSFDYHHIIPKSKGGNDRDWNRLLVCPNCHRKIFIENMEHGVHSVKRLGGIIILGKLASSAGPVLNYRKLEDNKEYYWYHRLREEHSAE